MYKLRIVLAVVLITGAATATRVKAQQAARHEFSIQQCIDFAHNHNTMVKNALVDYQVQVQTNRGVTSAALPRVTASAGLTDYIDIPTSLLPAEIFGGTAGTFIPVKFGTKYNSNGSVSLQQILFDGQVFVGLQARKTALDYASKYAEVTEQSIKVAIYKIYYQLVVSKTQIDLINANMARAEKLTHDAKVMQENGFVEQIDVDRLSVQLANLQTEKVKLQNTIDNGYLGLKYLMGMPIADELVLTDVIGEEDIKSGILDDSTYQYTDRKDYQYLQLVKKLNEYNIKRYQLSALPSISLSGVYTKTAQRSKFDIFGKGDWFTTSYLGLNISVPLFDGFARKSNVQLSRLALIKTENNIEDLKLSIDDATAQARKNFSTAIFTLDYQKKNMALAEQVYNQTKKKYEAGVGSTSDITNAETDLKLAQTNYINAMYDAIIAKIDYYNATGKLK